MDCDDYPRERSDDETEENLQMMVFDDPPPSLPSHPPSLPSPPPSLPSPPPPRLNQVPDNEVRQMQRKRKSFDCEFCNLNLDGPALDEHLKTEHGQVCRESYLKNYKVTNYDELLTRLFSCEICKIKERIDFKKHLRSNALCLNGYKEKFQLQDIDSIHKRVYNERRKRNASRSKSARSRKQKARRIEKEDLKTKTTVASLNEFRDKIAWANYRLCCVCKCNFREYGAKAVKETDEIFDFLELNKAENAILRRFEKFFVCNNCDKDFREKSPQNDSSDNEVNVKETVYIGEMLDNEDVMHYFPLQESRTEYDEETSEKKIIIMFPTCLEAIPQEKNDIVKKPEINDVYKPGLVKTTTISAMYLNEVKKYKQVQDSGIHYTGVIQDRDSKQICSVEQLKSCSRIVGSNDWSDTTSRRMIDRKEQLGLVHLVIEIKLDKLSENVLATCIIQEGVPVTLDKESLPNGEYRNHFKVHTDHRSGDDCDEMCINKVDLEEYLDKSDFEKEHINNKFVGTYVSACHQHMISFSKLILEAPDSNLYSENYQLFLMFDEGGTASIVGSIWPKALDELNANISRDNGEIDRDGLLKFVDRNVACTGNGKLIQKQFDMPHTEAKDLSSIVLDQQLKQDYEEEDCEVIGMPALESILVEPCSTNNLEAAKQMIDFVKNCLKELNIEHKMELKTVDFLEAVFEDSTGDITDDLKHMNIEVTLGELNSKIHFHVDERFRHFLRKFEDCPYIASYHYALSCCGNQDNSFIVLQRFWILDCFIKPFNPLWVKSIAPSTLHIVNSTRKFQELFLGFRSRKMVENTGLSKILFNHRFISLQEAGSLYDPMIKRVKNSTTEQFINSSPSRKLMFKKVHTNDAENYKMMGSRDQFKLLPDIISRHFDRIHKDDKMILAETGSWYDYVGNEKSKILSETYRNLEIPLSEDVAINRNKFPEFILCHNGDVLKKRKKKKILILPNFLSDYNRIYSKCLLYLPIESEFELKMGDIKELYEQKTEEGERIVDLNEKMVFPMKIYKPTENNVPCENVTAVHTEDEISDGEDIEEVVESRDHGEENHYALDHLLEILSNDEYID